MSRNTWRQNGDFSRYYGHNHRNPEGDARNIEFINTANNAIIRKISFVGTKNGGFRFFIKSDDNLDRTNIFRAEIRRLTLPYADAMDRYNIERNNLAFYEHGIHYPSLHFRTIDDPIFLNVMTLICNLEPSFESEMKAVVIGLINQYSNQQGTQSRQGRRDSAHGERVFIDPLMLLRFMQLLSVLINTASTRAQTRQQTSSARVPASHLLTGASTEEVENHEGALVVIAGNLPASDVRERMPLILDGALLNLILQQLSTFEFLQPIETMEPTDWTGGRSYRFETPFQGAMFDDEFPDFHRRDTFFHLPPRHHQPRMQHGLAPTAAPMAMQQFIDQTIFDAIPRPPVQIPEEGVNAKALAELDGFDTTSIPSHFSCPLSGDIMDHPVIDPTTLNASRTNIDEAPRVERAWLERAISESNGKSPFTRQPVVSPLIPDAQRKTDIENFVQEQVSKHSSAAFSKK
ncbi:MAG: hypothetical protein COY58_09255 [Gammaproteobacteria bacterium CG_4_10_14_0_8_um_filter_38_16]|nr:MAG: hypothetical protein COY58_09255 [Gammaproteobacteria bacterium CG_4_10_14_0_8_um_filter_38_16]PJA03563.1 MAG: hypothetical protein COX72_04545 [Gammaproteobacteria bacterium CG_4_10_14_0_2_um_filter_38_22]